MQPVLIIITKIKTQTLTNMRYKTLIEYNVTIHPINGLQQMIINI